MNSGGIKFFFFGYILTQLTKLYARLVYHRYVNMSEASRIECISRLYDYENWLGIYQWKICIPNIKKMAKKNVIVFSLKPFRLKAHIGYFNELSQLCNYAIREESQTIIMVGENIQAMPCNSECSSLDKCTHLGEKGICVLRSHL